MAYLEIHKGRTVVQSPLEGDVSTIGRQDGNVIVINDKDVSRRHCVIERAAGTYSICDAGSRNGTVVNGQRVQRMQLRSGDIITLGGTIAKFLDAPQATPARPQKRGFAWLMWIPAVAVMLATGVVVAWAVGLIGDRELLEQLRSMVGVETQVSHTTRPAQFTTPTPAPAVIAAPADPDAAEASKAIVAGPLRLESQEMALRYQAIDRDMEMAEIDALLGQFVAGRFIGKPVTDDQGRRTWELPPDGIVLAVFEVDGDAAAEVLQNIDNEPALLVAEVAGRLSRDVTTGGFVLHVGTVEILQALSSDESLLLEPTRELIGQRIVINPRFVASNSP